MGSWSEPCGGTGQRYSWPRAGCCSLASPPPLQIPSPSSGSQVASSMPCSPGSTTKNPRTRSPQTSTGLPQTPTEPPSTATELPLAHAGEPLATKTRTRIIRTRTRSHATATVRPAMSTVPHQADMAHPWTATEPQWTATEPQRLSMVPPLPITERPATRLRWRPTNQWSPTLLLPSVTRPPQLTQPPPPLTIMPPQAQVTELRAMVMELQATDTVPLVQDTELPAPGMELRTVPAEGPSVTKIWIRTTRTRTRSRATVMEPLSVTMPRLATSTANPADRATRTEEPSTSLPSSQGVGTRRMTRTRTKTRPLVMKTATGPPPMIPPPTKL